MSLWDFFVILEELNHFCAQKGVTMNTMSTRRENMRANFDIMDFSLSDEEMSEINALTVANFRISNADVVPYAPTWD